MDIQKTDLTPVERLCVAYLHYARGIEQQDLAVAYNVNGGRISEACTALYKAAQDPKWAKYRLSQESVKGEHSPKQAAGITSLLT